MPRHYLVVLALYVLVTLFTGAHFMADTVDYVNSVVAYAAGRSTDFWEFGHLFWRPLVWILFSAFRPVTKLLIGDDPRANVNLVVLTANWVSGLLSVLVLHALCSRLCEQRWVGYLTTIVFIFSHGFLNYAQTGSSYVPGLLLLLLGFYYVADIHASERTLRTAILGGLAIAGAVCIWFPYVLSIPAVVVSPLLFFKFDRRTFRLVLATGCFCGLFLALAYGVVAIGLLGITTVGSFRAWMSAASHDTQIRGVTRMIFGFARSFIYMGNDGIVFKRYLLQDTFNTVSLVSLLRFSVWKLGIFYLLLAALCVSLLRSSTGRRVLLLLAVNGIPVISFAVLFDGGAIERYFPLYPMIFLSLTVSLCGATSLPMLKYIAIACALSVILASLLGMAKPLLDRQQQRAVARVDALLPRLKPHSRIVTVNWQDDLINFGRSFPMHPINRLGTFQLDALVTPGTTYASRWREDFASKALKTWADGGDIWLSKRALSSRPLAEWNWVEGDEHSISWPDFSAFFSQLEMGESVGGDDGFILISPSSNNQKLLNNLLQTKQR